MKKASEPTLVELAQAAFREAAFSVIESAEQARIPLILGENGKVKRVDPNVYRKTLEERFGRHGHGLT